MIERPILFSTSMVRAILHGTKTMTRRPITRLKDLRREDVSESHSCWEFRDHYGLMLTTDDITAFCPLGRVGDRLWVRETWTDRYGNDFKYRADYSIPEEKLHDGEKGMQWRPSIHMPRQASRITLEVTNITVQKVQDINEEDARAEGIESQDGSLRHTFACLWDSFYAARGLSWAKNPWVWVVRFDRIAV